MADPAPVPSSRWYPLRVSEVRPESADSVSIALAIPDDAREAFSFQPGQYLTLRAILGGQELRRCYSICSGPDDPDLRIAIKRLPKGAFSDWACDTLRAGDSIDAMPPDGHFTVPLDPGSARLHAGFAAGSGITPVLAILQAVLLREPSSRFMLFYGNTTHNEIMFADTLQALRARHRDRFQLFSLLSREHQDMPLLNGRLDTAKIREILAETLPVGSIDEAYVCGPAGMIDEVTAGLTDAGMDAAHIHTERFTPAAATPHPAAATKHDAAAHCACITSAGVCSEVPVAPGESVLDAGIRAGLDLPFSCHAGMCATCRARLTQGTVEMEANDALSEDEVAAGWVLTCQSRPTAALVSVDYDEAAGSA